MHASAWVARAPFITGRTWRKSPPIIKNLPPNNWSFCIRSFSNRSIVSNALRGANGASSQMKTSYLINFWPCDELPLIDDESLFGMASLKVDDTVWPLG